MIASLTPATPVPPLERTGTESLFKRLDRDGNGRLTVSDGAAVVVSLSPQAIVRFAEATNQGNRSAAESGERNGASEEPRQAGQAGQTGQTGQLTAQRGPAPGAPAKAGPPPAGAAGAGAGKPAASTGVKTIQAADANLDDKVTAKEQQAYDARQAARLLAQLAEAQPKRGAPTPAARYQAVQALAA